MGYLVFKQVAFCSSITSAGYGGGGGVGEGGGGGGKSQGTTLVSL